MGFEPTPTKYLEKNAYVLVYKLLDIEYSSIWSSPLSMKYLKYFQETKVQAPCLFSMLWCQVILYVCIIKKFLIAMLRGKQVMLYDICYVISKRDQEKKIFSRVSLPQIEIIFWDHNLEIPFNLSLNSMNFLFLLCLLIHFFFWLVKVDWFISKVVSIWYFHNWYFIGKIKYFARKHNREYVSVVAIVKFSPIFVYHICLCTVVLIQKICLYFVGEQTVVQY